MRIVRVILKEQDDLFAEVIRICNHPYILDDYYVYIQLEPDLNSVRTGLPEAILEGSVISAKRTAASAALAAKHLQQRPATTAGIIGCGLIGFEIVRFLLAACPEIRKVIIFDLLPERAQLFQEKCRTLFSQIEVSVVKNIEDVLQSAPLIAFATTATSPHVSDLSLCAPGSTILHVSLRDLSPEVILSCDNVVDDIDHVTRAQTSIHLAEQICGNRDFIRCTLGDILNGTAQPKVSDSAITIFSPFGLGVLDMTVGNLTFRLAIDAKAGTLINSFLPSPWTQNSI